MIESRGGCLENFKLQPFLDAAPELLRADEVIRALDLLNNLPGYQRDHVPEEVIALRREIQKRMATANFYATSASYELLAPDNSSFYMGSSLRGMMMINEVKRMNEVGLIPYIGDCGSGEYWLPQLLDFKNLKFTYFPMYVNHPSHTHYKSRYEKFLSDKKDESQPTIFFAGEVIEHLWREEEIRFVMERWVGRADIIHVSTPCYTFDIACKDWREKHDLGHLRAYTPKEFMKTITDIFPEYRTMAYQSQILHARGVLGSTRFEAIKPDIEL